MEHVKSAHNLSIVALNASSIIFFKNIEKHPDVRESSLKCIVNDWMYLEAPNVMKSIVRC